MDDFVISPFLSSGATRTTVPVRLYSNARATATPALNALASLTLGLTILAAGLVCIVLARRSPPPWRQTASAIDELARLGA